MNLTPDPRPPTPDPAQTLPRSHPGGAHEARTLRPAPFEYVRPHTLDEALRLLAEHGDAAKLIAGGQSLVPMMNFRMARPALLIDINGLTSLDCHHRDGDRWSGRTASTASRRT